MGGTEVRRERTFPPSATSPSLARQLVAETLAASPFTEITGDACVAVSELVTNALVHAGTDIGVAVTVDDSGVLVEVADAHPQEPVVRQWSERAGTGRGLHMVASLADEWGTAPRDGGKVVWLRIGAQGAAGQAPTHRPGAGPDGDPAAVMVDLPDFPLLIHVAWQEHCSTLLREYLLMSLGDDEAAVFGRHAQAGEVLHLLAEHVPAPDLGDDPERVLAHAVEPDVSADVRLPVTRAMLEHVDVFDLLMNEAIAASEDGEMLVPPTLPELRELRRWVCDQVRSQVLTSARPEPYAADLHHEVVTEPHPPPRWDPAVVTSSDRAVIAADDLGHVIAVSESAAALLGHRPEDLVGRRVLTVIPHRYRQAHVAGMTLHLVEGRSTLIGQPVEVPVLRADGSEVVVGLLLRSERVGHGRIFLAELDV